jgi:hypothetical protein
LTPEFETLYGGSWHHPGAAWIAGLFVLRAIARSRSEARWFFVLLELEIVADALFTGAFSPVEPTSLVPNLMYYVAFVPFVLATAPREARA